MVYLQPKCSAQREHSNGVSFSFWDKKLEEHERKEIYVCNSFISRGKYFGCGFMLLGWTMPCTNESSLPCGNTALCVCITELQPEVGDVTSPPSPSSPTTKQNSTITCHWKPGGWILHKVRLLPSFFVLCVCASGHVFMYLLSTDCAASWQLFSFLDVKNIFQREEEDNQKK